MSIFDKLNYLQTTKNTMSNTLEAKNINLNNTPFSNYSNEIANISSIYSPRQLSYAGSNKTDIAIENINLSNLESLARSVRISASDNF